MNATCRNGHKVRAPGAAPYRERGSRGGCGWPVNPQPAQRLPARTERLALMAQGWAHAVRAWADLVWAMAGLVRAVTGLAVALSLLAGTATALLRLL